MCPLQSPCGKSAQRPVVDLDKGTAAVTSTEPVEDAVLKKAVEDAGYTVKGIQ